MEEDDDDDGGGDGPVSAPPAVPAPVFVAVVVVHTNFIAGVKGVTEESQECSLLALSTLTLSAICHCAGAGGDISNA